MRELRLEINCSSAVNVKCYVKREKGRGNNKKYLKQSNKFSVHNAISNLANDLSTTDINKLKWGFFYVWD